VYLSAKDLAELLGFLTGAACVWLLVKQNIWTWPAGIANNLIYIAIFYHSKLYGDMSLQFFYVAISLYGWWHWLHPDEVHRGTVEVSRIGTRAALMMAASTIMGVILFAFALRRFTDSNVPWIDGTTTSLSVSAQFMQSRKWIENWWVWITADAIYLGLYIYKHLYITTLLYAVFMAMCFAGLMQWKRDLRVDAREHATA
jgi:nicotinamide mononucleotide transporter